jgi:hypothetical protein
MSDRFKDELRERGDGSLNERILGNGEIVEVQFARKSLKLDCDE